MKDILRTLHRRVERLESFIENKAPETIIKLEFNAIYEALSVIEKDIEN